MLRCSNTEEEHGKVVCEVVAVVRKQIIALRGVDLLKTLQVVQDGLQIDIGLAHGDYLHRLAMMRSARIAGLHSSTEEVLNILEDQRSVIDRVNLYTKELFAHRPGQALAEIVHIELDVHHCNKPPDVVIREVQ